MSITVNEVIMAGSFGIVLTVNLSLAITGATSAKIIIKSPTKVRKEVVATITDEALGTLQYTTEQSDFFVTGTYEIQAIVLFGSTKVLRSVVGEIDVDKSL